MAITAEFSGTTVDTAGLRRLIELRLREAGLRVVPSVTPGMSWFHVHVSAAQLENRTASVDIRAIVMQPVVVVRTAKHDYAATWQSYRGSLYNSPEVQGQQIREITTGLLDEFVNDWLSVNPRR